MGKKRKEWEEARKNVRDEWDQYMGDWPKDSDGKNWAGHHIHDLKHGGDPTDPDNIIPVPKDVHVDLHRAYREAYKCEEKSPWNKCRDDEKGLPYED